MIPSHPIITPSHAIDLNSQQFPNLHFTTISPPLLPTPVVSHPGPLPPPSSSFLSHAFDSHQGSTAARVVSLAGVRGTAMAAGLSAKAGRSTATRFETSHNKFIITCPSPSDSLQGSTAARLVSLAGVRGTAMAAGLSVKALWVLDGHLHGGSSFSSLFSLQYDQRFSVDDVTTACVVDVLEQAQQLSLSYKETHLCWSAADLASSLQAFRPAQHILRQLAAEDLPPVQQSTAVFLEDISLDSCPTNRTPSLLHGTNGHILPFFPTPLSFPHQDTPLDTCPGCPANLSLLVPPSCTNCRTLPFSHSLSSCAARRIAYAALRRPDRDFTVAATVPAAALAAAGMFHESRAPLVLQATRRRGELGCGTGAWWGGWAGGSIWGEVRGAGGMWGGRGRGRGWKKWGRRSGWWGGVLGGRQWGSGGTESLWWWKWVLGGPARRELCAQLEIVEFLALAHAPSLFFALHDSPEARLLTAFATAVRGPLGLPPAAVEPAVCPSPVLPPLASLRFAQQMIMDGERWTVRDGRWGMDGGGWTVGDGRWGMVEKLGVMYCQIQKVASTSWKMWMRSERGFKHISSYFHTHHAGVNGLTLMRREMGEDDVMFHMTRRDLVKVVFVRNPLPRLLSAHGDKLANGGESRNVSMWNEVGFWVAALLERVAALVCVERLPAYALHASLLVITVQLLLGHERLKRHGFAVNSTTQLCGLDMIKYNIAGKYETLQEDMLQVVSRLNRSTENAMKIIKLGSEFHKTRAEQRMRAAYDKVRSSSFAVLLFAVIGYSA
ncbi:unnamed protein product [Closterium sp. NIES-65]|nr:unnamed protein product [Closterium sp. NIES-65]